MTALQDILVGTRALVFVNLVAGANRAQGLLPRVRQLFEAERIAAEFIVTEDSGDLESRARLAIANGRRCLLALGGDGTLQGLVNAAVGSDVVLGVLPAGGGNDVAAALGLPKERLSAARETLMGQPRKVDLLRARTADGRERFYAGGGGVGLDVEASRYAAGVYRRLPGRLRYVASAVRAWREFVPLNVRAEFPGSEQRAMESRVLLAGVLNAASYGAGLRVAPGAQIDDGWLDLSFVKNLSGIEMAGVMPRLLWNGTLPGSCLKQAQARRVVLGTDRPCFFHADGEILGPAPVEIEVVPRAIRLLAPSAR